MIIGCFNSDALFLINAGAHSIHYDAACGTYTICVHINKTELANLCKGLLKDLGEPEDWPEGGNNEE